ncbi:XRE family transcriptional regulator [Micromonospora fiedleri]|uniref:XRE family transcriptional regulator n=1 Tax=Micromonospora fiedleri TaxID=1157498 RepID=A0ABS1UZQ1_9ACTN|nr:MULTISPECIES: XRE family transcriptional regulator [Micromonospora]MBL6280390.1 XRE family transcriptional regulator [Micromonospora fiedleri]WSK40798.1 XRE family transcriptional regulator [Micromonospora maris]
MRDRQLLRRRHAAPEFLDLRFARHHHGSNGRRNKVALRLAPAARPTRRPESCLVDWEGVPVPRHPETMIVPNTVLAERRAGLPSPRRPGQRMSRAELADAVNAALDQLYPGRNLTAHYVDHRWVGKLERGEHRWPSEQRRAGLRHVLGADTDAGLGLYNPRRTDGRLTSDHQRYLRVGSMAAVTTAFTAANTAARDPDRRDRFANEADIVMAEADGQERHGHVSRRVLLQVLPTGVVASLTGADRVAARSTEVDPAVVEHFAVLRSVLVESDNRVGAAAVLPTARQQLDHIAGYRRAARGALHDALLSTEARWAEFAGWLSDDLGDRDAGAWWLAQALAMAQEAGDVEFTAYVFARMAQRAADAADQDRVLGLAHAAERAGSSREQVRAFAAVQRAHGHAVDGDTTGFRTAVDDAQHLAATTGADAHGLGSFCTTAYVSAQEGDGWLRLGHPRTAIRCFNRALKEWPESYQRERGRYLARAAAAHAAANEPEQAADAALAALNLARLTGSTRTHRQIKAVSHQLTAFSTEPAVQRFQAALTTSPPTA